MSEYGWLFVIPLTNHSMMDGASGVVIRMEYCGSHPSP